MLDNPVLIAALSGAVSTPKALFTANPSAQGFWYDPSDFSTMSQDNAGATPVTATGQVVGRILDKSGVGNHATQSNASFKPVLQQDASGFYYLAFDGTDDFLLTSAIDFSATNKMSVFAGVRKLSDAALGVLVELGTTPASNAGVFNMLAPRLSPSGGPYSFLSRGTTSADAVSINSAFDAPNTAVLTGIGDIANDTSILRINGAQSASVATDQGTGNYGNYVLYIGRRAGSTIPFGGRVYSMVGLNAAVTAGQITSTETWINGKTGAY